MEVTGWDFVALMSLLVPLGLAAVGFVALYFVIKAAVRAALRDAGLDRRPPDAA